MSFSSFGQIFIAHRILNSKSNDDSRTKKLISNIVDENAKKAVSFLCEETFSSSLVELIRDIMTLKQISAFFKALVQHYPLEYESLLSLQAIQDENDKESNKYECLFWNNSDLISLVLQFLYFSSLKNCSLVNSLWCFHSFSINSIYYLDLELLFDLKGFDAPRIWQRFINAKRIFYYYYDTTRHETHTITQSFVNNYSLFKNIERLHIVFSKASDKMLLPMYKAIAKTSGKLTRFTLGFSDISEDHSSNLDDRDIGIIDSLPLINLNGCQRIQLGCIGYPIMLSNNCNELVLKNINPISKNLCN